VPAPRAHEELWATERRNISVTGYGSKAFCQSLHEVARTLGATNLEPQIAGWEDFIFHHPIETMPGVRETLPVLQARGYRLVMFTKGNPEEQLGKLRRSGLAPHFAATEVVFEKTVAAYREVLDRQALRAADTWMIGNSPRSDINPAKAAGLRTVFIPYHTTWQHEIEEISPNGGTTIILEDFSQLTGHFL
jgi:putative hydrolase of the HAD superfamily